MKHIRNFCIVAHVDHGKSTLADRFLEITGTVEKRRMKEQYLDQLELERERGITIKMAPVRMAYTLNAVPYTLNLIDTPGHSDFSYEVSRALAAVEGAILLVDATQGIQAQTLANFHNARKAGLKIIGAVNKIDLNPCGIDEVIKSVAELIDVSEKEIFKVSGKTGQGAEDLLKAVIEQTPPPDRGTTRTNTQTNAENFSAESASSQRKSAAEEIFRALIFDSFYHEHKGIVAGVRVFGGEIREAEEAVLAATGVKFKIKELGYFAPELKTGEVLENGQIGYIATGLKNPEVLKIGDTILRARTYADKIPLVLSGYYEPQPVVFVSFYPEDSDDFDNLKSAMEKLKLNDWALKFEPDFNEFLGRGLKAGFLGRLHFEITAERLEKEFNVRTVHSFPSVSYKVRIRGTTRTNTQTNAENFSARSASSQPESVWVVINNPKDFPADYLEVTEPVAKIEILTPTQYLGAVINLQEVFRLSDLTTRTLGKTILVSASLPLAELIRDFDDKLKSVSAGYASLSYEISDYKKAEVSKLEVLVAGHNVGGLTRIVHKEDAEREARKTAERLKELLPRQQFSQAIQVISNGRIIARETIPPLRKDVTGYLYGGDRTRKMKLWKKQQRGKKKLKELAAGAKIDIPAKIFKELLKK